MLNNLDTIYHYHVAMREAVEKLKPYNATAANCHIVCLQSSLLPKPAELKLFEKPDLAGRGRKIKRTYVPSAVILSALPNPSNEKRAPTSASGLYSQAVRRVCPDTLE